MKTLDQMKSRLAELELDQLRARKRALGHRNTPSSARPAKGRGYTQAQCLRGDAGRELQALVRDLLAIGRIAPIGNAATAYRQLTGRDLRGSSVREVSALAL